MKYTYKDCEKRLKEIFRDVVNQPAFAYVLEGVLENAKVDDEFIQSAMNEKKSFKGMMNFAQEYARKFVSKEATCGVLDDNQMIEAVIEYFNQEEKEVKPVVNKAKATPKKSTKSTPKKTTVKAGTKVNKYGRVVKPLILDDEDDDEEMELPF